MLSQRVCMGDHDVPYVYGIDCRKSVVEEVLRAAEPADAALFVIDRAVADHAAPLVEDLSRSIRVVTHVVDTDERGKRLPLVGEIAEYAVAHRLSRRSVVVSMGGGLVGNVAGMVAALLYRGIRLIHLPTTPVAAFDSVLSLKQGINLSHGKNLCGAYLVPSLIACDLAWLTSLPHQRFLTGIAEMAKNVIAVEPKFEETFVSAVGRLRDRPADALLDLLEIGIGAKAPFLRDDPHERSAALVFEYGHTVGHALEFTAPGPMLHGEAVAWGMLVAAELSRSLAGLDAADVDLHHRLLACLDLPEPAARLGNLDLKAVAAALAADNKRGYLACRDGEVSMVLLERAGAPVGVDGRYPLVTLPIGEAMGALRTVARGRGAPASRPVASGPTAPRPPEARPVAANPAAPLPPETSPVTANSTAPRPSEVRCR